MKEKEKKKKGREEKEREENRKKEGPEKWLSKIGHFLPLLTIMVEER